MNSTPARYAALFNVSMTRENSSDLRSLSAIHSDAPIGIFDSGIGGLTVLEAIHAKLPSENLIYLGDTARVPYGNRTPQTIIRYALACANVLVERGVKALLIACNTASAHALIPLSRALPIPVYGVIDPVSRVALRGSQNKIIGVIGTRATIQSEAYTRAIAEHDPNASVYAIACPLFVPLVEEGWAQSDVARTIATHYLENFCQQPQTIDTLILGCTHYPVLKNIIAERLDVLGLRAKLCDCAQASADAMADALGKSDLLNLSLAKGQCRYLVTDNPEQFARVGSSFMKEAPTDVEHIDL